MGFDLVNRVFSSRLRSSLKLVALYLAKIAQDCDGSRVYPSLQTIANETGKSRPRVSAAVQELREMGVLELVRHGRLGRGCEYQFHAEKLPCRVAETSYPNVTRSAPIELPPGNPIKRSKSNNQDPSGPADRRAPEPREMAPLAPGEYEGKERANTAESLPGSGLRIQDGGAV